MNYNSRPWGYGITRLDKTAGYKLPYETKTPDEQREEAERIREEIKSKESLAGEINKARYYLTIVDKPLNKP